MLLSLEARELVLATWTADFESVARVLPPGLRPAEVDGRHAVSLAAVRWNGGRLGRLPVPAFSQLDVRVDVELNDEQAVFFLAVRVTAPGLTPAVLGAPYRVARLRVAAGRVDASGLGVSLRYGVGEPARAGGLVRDELAVFEAGGLRRTTITRGAAAWRRADALEPPRADLLVAYGFELGEPPEVLYAERPSLALELPPEKISASRSAR